VEGKIQQTAEQELHALTEAHQAIDDIMGSSYQHHRQFFNEVYPNPTQI
jgi:hypothetical protein